MMIHEWDWKDVMFYLAVFVIFGSGVYVVIVGVISDHVYKRGVKKFTVCRIKKNRAKGSSSPVFDYHFKVKNKVYTGVCTVPMEFNLLDRDVKGEQYIVAFVENRPRFNKIIEFAEVSKYNLSPPPEGWAKREYIPVPVDKTLYTLFKPFSLVCRND